MKDSDPNWRLLPPLLIMLVALIISRCHLTNTQAELRQTRAKLLEALENQPVRSTGDHSIPYYPEKL